MQLSEGRQTLNNSDARTLIVHLQAEHDLELAKKKRMEEIRGRMFFPFAFFLPPPTCRSLCLRLSYIQVMVRKGLPTGQQQPLLQSLKEVCGRQRCTLGAECSWSLSSALLASGSCSSWGMRQSWDLSRIPQEWSYDVFLPTLTLGSRGAWTRTRS